MEKIKSPIQQDIASWPEGIVGKKQKEHSAHNRFSMGFSMRVRPVTSPWRTLPTDSSLVLVCTLCSSAELSLS